jgi:hypothetical protein
MVGEYTQEISSTGEKKHTLTITPGGKCVKETSKNKKLTTEKYYHHPWVQKYNTPTLNS